MKSGSQNVYRDDLSLVISGFVSIKMTSLRVDRIKKRPEVLKMRRLLRSRRDIMYPNIRQRSSVCFRQMKRLT